MASRAFGFVLEQIRARVPQVPRAVGVYLLLALLLALACAWGFTTLASSVLEGETRRFDAAVLQWLNNRATPRLDRIALEVTTLGDTLVIAVILLISSALLWVTAHRYSVFLLWVATVGSAILILALKAGFDRPRPTLIEWRAHFVVETSSFPSGHALGSMVVYAVTAYLIARLQAERWLRRLTIIIAALLILLIGLSRVYLGVHYPSDVIGGYAVGFAWATFCALGVEAVRYLRSDSSSRASFTFEKAKPGSGPPEIT